MPTLASQLHQFFYTLLAIPRAWRFIWHYRLWQGLRQYGWVSKALILLAALVSLYLLSDVLSWLNDEQVTASGYHVLWGEQSLLGRLSTDSYALLTGSSAKWIILILVEVVIYHFMRAALKEVLGRDMPDAHTFKPFLDAQKRMIGVSITAWILELLLLGVGWQIAAGALPVLDWFTPLTTLLVQAYLLGFAIADNYTEQFELSVNQSMGYLRRNYPGICLGLGLPLIFLLQIPVLGALLGPILISVTAAIVMRELTDLHLVGYIPTPKEEAKLKKKAARAARKASKQ